MQFQYYRTLALVGPQWHWRLVASNGQIIASGEGYFNKQDCLHTIGLVQGTNAMTPVIETAS